MALRYHRPQRAYKPVTRPARLEFAAISDENMGMRVSGARAATAVAGMVYAITAICFAADLTRNRFTNTGPMPIGPDTVLPANLVAPGPDVIRPAGADSASGRAAAAAGAVERSPRRRYRRKLAAAPVVPAGQVALYLTARFGRDMPRSPAACTGASTPTSRTIPERCGSCARKDRRAPTLLLPPGGYIVHVSFGLAQALKKVQLRAETVREVFDIPAGGIRIEGQVGDARIPSGQIHFDIFKGSQFEPGDKRAARANVRDGRRRCWCPRAPTTSCRITATATRWCAPTSACRPASSPT